MSKASIDIGGIARYSKEPFPSPYHDRNEPALTLEIADCGSIRSLRFEVCRYSA